MKRAIGIFLTLSSLLTFLIVDMLYDPVKKQLVGGRKDNSMDLFFNDFADDKEFQALFSDKE
ncbi:hypothetical protein [Peribacillus frigoritolerans]|uniref:hypothetical protein n=1 Tax=Peribacillus frigoritolerans TaxID=450367 RepID=UPI00207A102A|nr:hypothetical protein [Peribacillus frigoritolerans]USK75940.1 hypothetical protein LIT31_05065 [Peribacillus frigoritolerans]